MLLLLFIYTLKTNKRKSELNTHLFFAIKKQSTKDCTSIYKAFTGIILKVVQVKGLEPPWIAPLDPKSSASANSATPAYLVVDLVGLEPTTARL